MSTFVSSATRYTLHHHKETLLAAKVVADADSIRAAAQFGSQAVSAVMRSMNFVGTVSTLLLDQNGSEFNMDTFYDNACYPLIMYHVTGSDSSAGVMCDHLARHGALAICSNDDFVANLVIIRVPCQFGLN